MTAASSKSLTPQTSRPSASRQVPKFSRCRSPTESTGGVFARSVQMRSTRFAQRKKVARRNTKALSRMRSCFFSRSASTTRHCLRSQRSYFSLSLTNDMVLPPGLAGMPHSAHYRLRAWVLCGRLETSADTLETFYARERTGPLRKRGRHWRHHGRQPAGERALAGRPAGHHGGDRQGERGSRDQGDGVDWRRAQLYRRG